MRNFSLLFKRLFILSFILISVSCSSGGGYSSQAGYDGRQFDISLAQDGSLIATSTKNGNYYDLTITGSGKAIDYDKKELVPWNPIIKKISSVKINEGIENIGDFYFYSLPLDYFILPSTVSSVGDNSFNVESYIYTYGSKIENLDNIYYYSQFKPTDSGNYFYLDKDGIPHIWEICSVLFIGNSFTYYAGNATDPSVPKYFELIAENLNQEVNVDYVLKGSHTLTKFASVDDEYGQIVDEKLRENDYDYVILQEQSTTPIENYNTFLSAVKSLKVKIDNYQDDCQTILYETWGSEKAIEGTKYQSVGEMELDLRTAYQNAGKETGCQVNYIGKAFTYVYENLDINIYYEDNRHQNNLGAYLSAAVHVKSLFGFNVSNCDEYAGLNEEECKALLSVADNNL